jgi:adenylate cyclase
MTDLADFTPLIEHAEPEQLVGWLNEYIDGMIRVVFAHEGTLDRIVGDGLSVMFSAPVSQQDHRERALACALAMDEFAVAFQAARQAEGIAWGTTRIGAHAGPVIVGNFGGRAMHDYRALGDAINTAARLETANKHFGTRVCLSEAIVSARPGFVGRPVGALILKGKSIPVDAWEPLTPARAASGAAAAYRQAFALMAQGDGGAAAAFDRVLSLDASDGLARFHGERLRRGEVGKTVVLSEK